MQNLILQYLFSQRFCLVCMIICMTIAILCFSTSSVYNLTNHCCKPRWQNLKNSVRPVLSLISTWLWWARHSCLKEILDFVILGMFKKETLQVFHRFRNHMFVHNAVQPAPYPGFIPTPSSGPDMTPISKYTTLRPAKLSFSPHPTRSKPKGMERSSFCLMYPTHQALQQNSLQIEDIQTLFASPILQENLHYLLMDHSLDEAKISETLKYLGIPKCLFVQYINRVYPQHFYTILSNLNGSTQ